MRGFVVLLIAMLTPGSVSATSWQVNPDGSGDFPTIQAAIDGSAIGDTILLGEGSFTGAGNRELLIPRPRVFAAAGTPGSAILDAEGFPLGDIGEDPDASEVFRFEHIGFHNGDGFQAHWNKQLEFVGCRFVNCSDLVFVWSYVLDLGGIEAIDCDFMGCQGSLHAKGITLQGCHFEANLGALTGGYVLEATDCEFIDNSSVSGGYGSLFTLSGDDFTDSDYAFTGCVFFRNEADALIRVPPWGDNSLSLAGCTLVDNAGIDSSDIHVEQGHGTERNQSVTIERCLFAYRGEGSVFAVDAGAEVPQLSDCDLFGNTGGDWTGEIADQYGVGCNMSVEPLFCDEPAGDLTLYASSPCLPANNACGVQIGAEGQGCMDPTAVEPAPWADLRLSAQPNPFNPKVRLRFALESAGPTSLTIYDTSGRRVAALLDGALLPAGEQAIDWNAAGLASGVYLARLVGPAGAAELKLTLLR